MAFEHPNPILFQNVIISSLLIVVFCHFQHSVAVVISVGSRTRYYANGTSVTCQGVICPLGKSKVYSYISSRSYPWDEFGLGMGVFFMGFYSAISLQQ